MNQTKIALKYANGIVLSPNTNTVENTGTLVTSLTAEMLRLGYVPSDDLYSALCSQTVERLTQIYSDVLRELRALKGADVEYKPMYPNFPKQVMEASDMELFINAIVHYWTFGMWKPEYEALPREYGFETANLRMLDVITEDEFDQIFPRLVGANESLSTTDKSAILWFLDNRDVSFDGTIPFKENLCFVVGALLDREKDITSYISTATDVLRVATYLSGGDISLAEDTKFKSFSRKTRRTLVRALQRVAREEDIVRHRGKWVRLFHTLHVGEYSKDLWELARKIRNNEKIETFNSKVEAAIAAKDVVRAAELLATRPGEFARRLDKMVRMAKTTRGAQQLAVATKFLSVADKVDTRVLLQVLGHLQTRTETVTKRVVFPKGNTQKAQVVRTELEPLGVRAVTRLQKGIRKILLDRFSDGESLGKVWIDPELTDCPLPTQQRSASEGALQVARGTRLPFGDETKNTLRFFIYWVGLDIDLSATMHDENFNEIGHVSWTALRSSTYQSYHSGDIVRAPNGASEFIDITIDGAVESGARYITMNVYVFSGPTFAEHKKVYAGWMTRSKPNSNEIYDPKTVEQRIDLTSESRNAIPVIFDLVERKAIWADLTTISRYHNWGNTVESNRATTQEMVEAMLSLDNKVSLYELFLLHAEARGELVEDKEEADTVFSLYEGITPYDISLINSEYVV